MDDVQSLRNKIADLQRKASLKRGEAEQHLKNANTYRGASQPDQALDAEDQANRVSEEAADIEREITDTQKRLADKEAQAADLGKQEQDLQSKLGQVQQEKDKILGKSGGFGPIL